MLTPPKRRCLQPSPSEHYLSGTGSGDEIPHLVLSLYERERRNTRVSACAFETSGYAPESFCLPLAGRGSRWGANLLRRVDTRVSVTATSSVSPGRGIR